MKFSWALMLVLMTLMSVAIPAPARAAPPGPCTEDVKKFCKQVKPGDGRIRKCLSRHEKELSLACREHTEEMQERADRFLRACQGDTQKFCKGIKPGSTRIFSCLKTKEKELSAECRTESIQGKEAVRQTSE
jgi:hypothetical protein